MKFTSIAALAIAFVLFTSHSALAHEEIYEVIFSGAAEAPPNASPGTGTGLVTFDLDLVTMRVQADFQGLIGNVSAAHIHCCTAVAGTGTAGVATVTPSFTGFPTGGTSGTYDFTYDMTQAASYNAAFINNNGGTVSSALNALLAGVADGKAYFNIHTSSFPGGEIRGFLVAVPEPTSLSLAGLSLLGMTLRRRR